MTHLHIDSIIICVQSTSKWPINLFQITFNTLETYVLSSVFESRREKLALKANRDKSVTTSYPSLCFNKKLQMTEMQKTKIMHFENVKCYLLKRLNADSYTTPEKIKSSTNTRHTFNSTKNLEWKEVSRGTLYRRFTFS